MTKGTDSHHQKRLYFGNLDGLRAIAVMMVVVWHVEIHKVRFGFKQSFFNDTGFMGVSVFFVLSGFLITYILQVEKAVEHRVNFKAFYLRRVLRIWPLYFFALFFGFFIYPAGMSWSTLVMCLLLMPNVPFMMMHIHPFVQPIWSIGVEEQFYLFQPQFFRIKNRNVMLWSIISLTLVIDITKWVGFRFPSGSPMGSVANYLYFFRIDQLLMGSVAAILLHNYKNQIGPGHLVIKLLLTKYAQVIAWLIFAGHIFMSGILHYIFANNLLFVLAVIVIILNLCMPDSSIIQLENRVLRYLGKVSYGIYLLHNIALVSVLYLMQRYFANASPIVVNVVVYGLAIPLAILLAALSYKYYESYFLRLKNRYATVVKGDLINNCTFNAKGPPGLAEGS
ncbi:MAG: acyltransferase family protein [Mucilaginibacter sp.]